MDNEQEEKKIDGVETTPTVVEEQNIVENVVREDSVGVSPKEVLVENKKEHEKDKYEFTVLGCTSTLDELKEVAATDKDLNKEEITAELTKFLQLLQSSVYTAHAEIINEVLNKLSKEDITHSSSKVSVPSNLFGTNLKGAQAELAFTAKVKGFKKVYLYNSGFHVIIRPWTMGELSMFFQSVDMDDKELGKLLGYYRFTIHDAFIKQKFVELFPSCIISSNLKNWRNNRTLFRNISIHDYDTLLWAVCSLMYKEPIGMSITCYNCKNKSDILEYDASKLCMYNNKVISGNAFQFVHEEKEVTTEELDEYKKDLIKTEGKISYKNILYKLKVPSLLEYVEFSTKNIAALVAACQNENDITNRKLANAIIIDFNRSYIPWIDEICMLENNEVSISSKDKTAFPAILETLESDDSDSEFHMSFTDFVKETMGTLIGYIAPKCSKCGKSPSTNSGFIGWDIEKYFFDLTYRILSEKGLSLMQE